MIAFSKVSIPPVQSQNQLVQDMAALSVRNVATFDAELTKAGIDVAKLKEASAQPYKLSPLLVAIIQAAKKALPSPPQREKQMNSQPSQDDLIRKDLRDVLYGLFSDSEKMSLTVVVHERRTTISRLGLAVLFGGVGIVQMMMDRGYTPGDCCDRGFTACHMAAMLGRIDILRELYLHGGLFAAASSPGLTTLDILKARGFALSSEQRIEVYKDLMLPVAEVSRITGRDYLASNIYSTDAFFEQWLYRLSNSRYGPASDPPMLAQVYATYCAIQEGLMPYDPPVVIRKMGPEYPPQFRDQHELVAKRNIKAGVLVLEYTAYVVQKGKSGSQFIMGGSHGVSLEALHGGSFAEIANHGPPNCIVQSVIYKGLERLLMHTIAPIPAGAPVRINYGRPFVLYQGFSFVELCPQEVEEFVEKTKQLSDFTSWAAYEKIENYAPECRITLGSSQMPYVKEYVDQMKDYLYEFPDHLFSLVRQQKLKAGDLQNFLKSCSNDGFVQKLELSQTYSDELDQKLRELEG